MDRMVFKDKEYELAKFTMKSARLIEEAEKASEVNASYRKQYEFVKLAIGTDNVNDILGSSNLDEIDLVELVLLYNEITAGYERRIEAQREEKDAKLANSTAVKTINDVASSVKVITSAGIK